MKTLAVQFKTIDSECMENALNGQLPSTDMQALAERIAVHDREAEVLLASILTCGMRFLIARNIGPGGPAEWMINEMVDRVLARTFSMLRSGQLLANGFVDYVRRAAKEQAEDWRRANPATPTLARERVRQAAPTLAVCQLPERHREVLTRYYVNQDTMQAICEVMRLTIAEFRSIKAEATTAVSASFKLRRSPDRSGSRSHAAVA